MTKLEKLQRWLLYTPVGQYVLMNEKVLFEHNVANIFGFYAIQIGLPDINFLEGNKIAQRYILPHDIKCDLSFLPFANNSIDLIICPHTLEFTDNYEQLLEECYRILMPHGKLIITGFNKYSLFSLFGRKQEIRADANFISLNKIKKQLRALKFQINGGKFFGYRPPINNLATLARMAWLDKIGNRWFPTLANNYALLVSKEIITTTRIKPDRQKSFSAQREVSFGGTA